MSLIDSKWKSCILDELRLDDPLRSIEIYKRLPEAASHVFDINRSFAGYIQARYLQALLYVAAETVYREAAGEAAHMLSNGKNVTDAFDQLDSRSAFSLRNHSLKIRHSTFAFCRMKD